MKPWNKRLADLKQLIQQADATYFEPELFRLNVNNAIQTARTVTFIIQKQKGSIPGFSAWYENEQKDLRNDPIMRWLVDARNKIEKQGDLETHSECRAEVLFSYTQPGSRLILPDERLLFAGIKKLTRHAIKTLPTGVSKAASILIERRWVASSFPSMELIDVLEYGYSRLLALTQRLNEKTGEPHHTSHLFNRTQNGSNSRRVYIKLSDRKLYSQTIQRHHLKISDPPNEEHQSLLRQAFQSGISLDQRLTNLAAIARDLFNRDGYHITLLIYLDANGNPRGTRNVQFDDQADKFYFWHNLAREAETDTNFCGLIFISEYWNREGAGFPTRAISELPISGEGLKASAADASGNVFVIDMPIIQTAEGKRAEPRGISAPDAVENYLTPILNAWKRRQHSA